MNGGDEDKALEFYGTAQKLDARDGRILEQITLSKDDPDPHGMCMYIFRTEFSDCI